MPHLSDDVIIPIFKKHDIFRQLSYDLDLNVPADQEVFDKWQPHLNMAIISFYRPLSLAVIEKYRNVLSWRHIAIYQNASDEMIRWAIGENKLSPRCLIHRPFTGNLLFLEYINQHYLLEHILPLRQFDEAFLNTIKSFGLYTGSGGIVPKTQAISPADRRGDRMAEVAPWVYQNIQSNYDFTLTNSELDEKADMPHTWDNVADLLMNHVFDKIPPDYHQNIGYLHMVIRDALGKNLLPGVEIYRLNGKTNPMLKDSEEYGSQREYVMEKFNPHDMFEVVRSKTSLGKKALVKYETARTPMQLNRMMRDLMRNSRWYCELCNRPASVQCTFNDCSGDFCGECANTPRPVSKFPHLCNHGVDTMRPIVRGSGASVEDDIDNEIEIVFDIINGAI